MKKMKYLSIVLVLWIIGLWVEAPPTYMEQKIPEPKKETPFGIEDPVLLAFMWYESRYVDTAEQKITGARGVLQILPIMIKEANRIRLKQGSDISYTWEDAWSVDKSVEIWYLVQQYHNPEYNLEKACQIWFGKGVQYDGMTWIDYHEDVNNYLTSLLTPPAG